MSTNNKQEYFKGYPIIEVSNNSEVPSALSMAGLSSDSSYVVRIPGSTTELEKEAFKKNAFIVAVIFHGQLESIGWHAFAGCTSLEEIEIPDSVWNIGFNAFQGCKALKKAVLPKDLEKLDNNLFDGCTSLQEVTILEGVSTIGYGTFFGCSALEKLIIPDSVEDIKTAAFEGCTSLREISVVDKSLLDNVKLPRYVSINERTGEIEQSPEQEKNSNETVPAFNKHEPDRLVENNTSFEIVLISVSSTLKAVSTIMKTINVDMKEAKTLIDNAPSSLMVCDSKEHAENVISQLIAGGVNCKFNEIKEEEDEQDYEGSIKNLKEELAKTQDLLKAKDLYEQAKAKTKGIFSCDYEGARRLFEECILLGYGEAAYDIANMHKIGIGGCKKDFESYLEYIDKGIELGCGTVAKKAADDFYIGSGVVLKDKEQAEKYYKTAAELGNAESAYILAESYYYRHFTQKNIISAITYYKKADVLGHPKAKQKADEAIKRYSMAMVSGKLSTLIDED